MKLVVSNGFENEKNLRSLVLMAATGYFMGAWAVDSDGKFYLVFNESAEKARPEVSPYVCCARKARFAPNKFCSKICRIFGA